MLDLCQKNIKAIKIVLVTFLTIAELFCLKNKSIFD